MREVLHVLIKDRAGAAQIPSGGRAAPGVLARVRHLPRATLPARGLLRARASSDAAIIWGEMYVFIFHCLSTKGLPPIANGNSGINDFVNKVT